jgi:hypothetical protein
MIIEFPSSEMCQQYMCAKCECDLFMIANYKGSLIAVCDFCESPTVPISCACLLEEIDKVEDNFKG